MADKYLTGHKPKLSFEQLVAQANANSFFLPAGSEPKQPRKRPKKLHRAVRAAAELSEGDRKALELLLLGRAVLKTVEGQSYVLWREGDFWHVRSAAPGGHEHTVSLQTGTCSCEDCKFRAHVCKHMKAVEAMK